MDRCPICRGRLDTEAQCQRCGADLSLVIQTHNKAEDLSSQAIKQMADGKFIQAQHLLEQALALEHSPFRQQLLEFVLQCNINNTPAHLSEIYHSQTTVDSTKKVSLLKRISSSFRTHS